MRLGPNQETTLPTIHVQVQGEFPGELWVKTYQGIYENVTKKQAIQVNQNP